MKHKTNTDFTGWTLLLIYIFLSLCGAMVAYFTPRLKWWSLVIGFVFTMWIIFFTAGAPVVMGDERPDRPVDKNNRCIFYQGVGDKDCWNCNHAPGNAGTASGQELKKNENYPRVVEFEGEPCLHQEWATDYIRCRHPEYVARIECGAAVCPRLTPEQRELAAKCTEWEDILGPSWLYGEW